MNRYRYDAADASGKLESGHLEADSQSGAFAHLRSRGLTALRVQVENNHPQAGGSRFGAKLSDNDLAWATRQLARTEQTRQRVCSVRACHWKLR